MRDYDSIDTLIDRELGKVHVTVRTAWRDERGRIVREPSDYESGREYRFIELPDHDDHLRYAHLDAERLESYERQNWYMIGIVARVTVNGREIGHGSLWGVESDSDPAYIRSTAREVAGESIGEARSWLASLAT